MAKIENGFSFSLGWKVSLILILSKTGYPFSHTVKSWPLWSQWKDIFFSEARISPIRLSLCSLHFGTLFFPSQAFRSSSFCSVLLSIPHNLWLFPIPKTKLFILSLPFLLRRWSLLPEFTPAYSTCLQLYPLHYSVLSPVLFHSLLRKSDIGFRNLPFY